MDTFEKEISFLSKQFNPELNDGVGAFEIVEVKKIAKFKELSRRDHSQHKLHFKIVGIFSASEKEEQGADKGSQKVEINSDAMYDLTVKSINTLLLIDEGFTASDKAEFLEDSGAILMFGMWLMGEKLAPFFSNLTSNLN